MKNLKAFILILLLSVGLNPTDIFLYAQQSNSKKLKDAEQLISIKNTETSFLILNELLKDSVELRNEEKADLFLLFTKYYALKNKEEKEIYYNKKAEILFRSLNNEDKLCDILYAKFDLLINQAKLAAKLDAKKNLDEFYDLSLKNNNKRNIVKAYKGYARLKFNPKEYKEALINYDLALKEVIKLKDTLGQADIISNKGLIISSLYNKQDSARQFYFKAIKLFKKINNQDAVFSTSLNVGLSYVRDKDIDKALTWFQKADSIPLKEYKNNNKMLLYGHMSNTYEQLKDYKNALDYVWLYNDYKDSVDVKAQNIAISDIQVKYNSLEKEKENIELKAANKKKQLYLLGVAGTSIALLIFSYLGYRNVRRKKEIAEKNIAIEHQKFVALVKDQELISMDSMIEGQEIERKKIAEDLHDNLGSTLATLKLHFDNYRDNISKGNDKQIKMLDSTEKILDEAYSKVRTMAHANQASVMSEHSLVEAVKALARNVSLAKKTHIEVIDFGFERPLNHTLEITMFRIIQELITNIVKHASAKKATIDLTLFEDSLGLIVEDDGVGFDVNIIRKHTTGMGLSSIKERIERMNGTFDIDTNIGNGTSILIDIPILPEI